MKIALDAMGGDFAPERPVAAAVEALRQFPQIDELHLVGDEARIQAELDKINYQLKPDSRLKIKHCTEVVEMDDAAVKSVRRKKDSSISRSVELVKDQKADAVVSAGHTGAMVATTTIKLRTLPGVARPGIASVMPTETNLFVLIDAGANIEATPEHLAQYGVMGSIFSQHVLKFENPKVGLMSVGSEDVKGTSLTKEAFKLLSQAPINFSGNIEGHDLFERPVEVVVCDGFVGNVVLKTSESLANAIFHWLKVELKKSPIRLFGAWLAQSAFRAIKRKTNYEEYGGSLLLGVNGICVIAHGSSTVRALVNAIRVATEAIEFKVNPRIVEQISKLKSTESNNENPQEVASTS